VCSLSLVSLQSPHLDLEKRRRRSGVKATASCCSDCSPLGSETAPPFRLQGSSVAAAEGRRAGDGETTRAAVVLFCARKTAGLRMREARSTWYTDFACNFFVFLL
jgi:hypothetical protein